MEEKDWNFLNAAPEGTVIVALDSREDGALFGAVRLQGGEEVWLDYEMEFAAQVETVLLYEENGNIPALVYHVRGQLVELEAMPELLTVLWNRGGQTLFPDGEALPSGEIKGYAPANTVPWLARYAGWLPRRHNASENMEL